MVTELVLEGRNVHVTQCRRVERVTVQWGRIDVGNLAAAAMTHTDPQRYRLRRGDLLVCEGGEIGRAAIWDAPIAECFCQKALHRLRSDGEYSTFFMMYLLNLWTASGYLTGYVTQTSIPHLPKDKFEMVPVPVPPLPEQRAIAEALSDVDELISALDNADREEAGDQAGYHAAASHRQDTIPYGVS